MSSTSIRYSTISPRITSSATTQSINLSSNVSGGESAVFDALKSVTTILAGVAFSLSSHGTLSNSVNFARSIASTNVVRRKDQEDVSSDVLGFYRSLSCLRQINVQNDAEYSRGFDAIFEVTEPLIEDGRLDRVASLLAMLDAMNVDSYFEAAVYRSASDYKDYIPNWDKLLNQSVRKVPSLSLQKECFGGLLELRG
ncbi:hypothetical protein HQ393_07870 [Chitinibacter bivalviorum]|uniref:Uncharacterized protein n=1 Tax=Chitinibacter bivalviorum TaxID=2739434 RepID=A0A7H9BIJ4_9NEIS|nr:hypothetical protein [Chitinibacter bivalviorum]QLG88172.1 hypothetical protein HQ393_07870 [Chitinibacter bivalviorum]